MFHDNKYSFVMSGSWTKQQEEVLEKFVEKGIYTWAEMSHLMTKKFPDKPRTAKQCRQRYCDFILFKGKILKKGQWGQEEAETFYRLILNYGLSWTKMAGSLLEGNNKVLGSSNSLKNKYYANLKTYMKKLGALLKKKDPQLIIKWTIFKRFVCLNFYGLSQQLKAPEKHALAKEIIENSILKKGHPTQEYALKIYHEVNNFSKNNKSLNSKKSVKFNSYKITSANKHNDKDVPLKVELDEPELKIECLQNWVKQQEKFETVKIEEELEQRLGENVEVSTIAQNGRKNSNSLKETEQCIIPKKIETQADQEIFVQKPRKKKKIFFTLDNSPPFIQPLHSRRV